MHLQCIYAVIPLSQCPQEPVQLWSLKCKHILLLHTISGIYVFSQRLFVWRMLCHDIHVSDTWDYKVIMYVEYIIFR